MSGGSDGGECGHVRAVCDGSGAGFDVDGDCDCGRNGCSLFVVAMLAVGVLLMWCSTLCGGGGGATRIC